MVSGVLFDLDGVLYNGEDPIDGAAEAVASVRRSGIPSLFVTNTTSRPRSALRAKLARFGIRVGLDEFLTPPVAAAAWIRGKGEGRAALFVPEATREDFVGLEAEPGAEDLHYVVIGDLGAAWDYATLNRAFRLLHGHPGRELIALGLTRYWQSSDGANLDVAPFAAALECATGLKATVMGKPAKEFFLQAADLLGLAPAKLLMIGDDLQADALGARRAGLRSALVRTGKFRPGDLEFPEQPDWVLDSVRDLPSLLAHGRD
jgi:HAD superfamily hydrolase (TIGR01458 family)